MFHARLYCVICNIHMAIKWQYILQGSSYNESPPLVHLLSRSELSRRPRQCAPLYNCSKVSMPSKPRDSLRASALKLHKAVRLIRSSDVSAFKTGQFS